MAQQVQLEIIVVGGGIAGFAAAAALRQAGHKITLVEKSPAKREPGFMITIGSNAARVLDSIGFDFERARGVECNTIDMYNGFTGERISRLDAQAHAKTESEKTFTIYRQDLWTELLRLVSEPSDIYPSPTILFGTKAVAVNLETGTVNLESGSTLTGDLIVAADGERSIVKAAYSSLSSARLYKAPFKTLRTIIPTSVLEADPVTARLLVKHRKRWSMYVGKDDFYTLSWFEGRGGELQDIESGYFAPDEDVETDPTKARAILLEKFKDFHPDIVAVLQKTTTVTDWPVYFSKPLPEIHTRRSVLIGDAAHSMFPTTGQGGCQGLEDAACLSILFSASSLHSRSPEELARKLDLYEKIRKERTKIVQWLSPLRPGQEEEIRVRQPQNIIHRTAIRTGEEHVRFLFGYDIIKETLKALKEVEMPRAVL